jgi:hypothetical protein
MSNDIEGLSFLHFPFDSKHLVVYISRIKERASMTRFMVLLEDKQVGYFEANFGDVFSVGDFIRIPIFDEEESLAMSSRISVSSTLSPYEILVIPVVPFRYNYTITEAEIRNQSLHSGAGYPNPINSDMIRNIIIQTACARNHMFDMLHDNGGKVCTLTNPMDMSVTATVTLPVLKPNIDQYEKLFDLDHFTPV